MSFADEFWQDIIDKIEKMNSSQSFEVMSDFASRIDAADFRIKLEGILNRSKPYRHFKHEIDNSDYREDWFEFKHNAYKAFVIKQI